MKFGKKNWSEKNINHLANYSCRLFFYHKSMTFTKKMFDFYQLKRIDYKSNIFVSMVPKGTKQDPYLGQSNLSTGLHFPSSD